MIHTGDCLEVLRGMEDESINCVVTSPPYWGLRDYGVEGQLGLEATPEEYLSKMVAVFREVRRVLRSDGTCWVNMGDSYANDGKWGGATGGKHAGALHGDTGIGRTKQNTGLKPKDLAGIPWRLALALQADGWWLRSDIIWSKKNPMPESVTDRPTKSHEYIFLLTKSAQYWYDADAVREDAAYGYSETVGDMYSSIGGAHGQSVTTRGEGGSRNRRSVWTIATQAFPDAHFATFPEALVEPCIKAGCPHKACAECGAPWVRVVEKTITNRADGGKGENNDRNDGGKACNADRQVTTLGFRPTCDCDADTHPGTVLDPFFGSGTVGLVATKLDRKWVGIELNEEYAEMARKRIGEAMPLFAGATV